MHKEESEKLFDDLIGQETAVELLKAAITKKRIAPAYLFAGPQGVGQCLTAQRFLEGLITGGSPSLRERIRLRKLNHPDLIWIEPTYLHQGNLISKSLAQKEGIKKRNPPQIRLEQIRSIQRFLGKKPIEANLGMVVIEAVETMNEASANALLKTLEEPGNGSLILISSRPEKLLPTIRSRCQKIPFSRLNYGNLKKVLSKTNFDQTNHFSFESASKEIINLSNGSPGALIDNFQTWKEFPEDILIRIKTLPKSPVDALSLARDVTETLDLEQQIWLINWLQQYIWAEDMNQELINQLETLRRYLLSFVQPRLAWEVTFLKSIRH